MKKIIGYRIFALLYYIGCIVPVKKNLFFCVMTHDGSDDSSVGVVVKAIKERMPDAEFAYVKKESKSGRAMLGFIFGMPFKLARASMILMDNEFLPLAFIKPRKCVKVVQLWHGTGTIKKFGHDISEGKELEIVKKADSKITHLIVNSDYTADLYARVFGVSQDKVYVTGIPRTDELFNNLSVEQKTEMFYNRYLGLKKKRIVLYAPTFRDEEASSPRVMIDLDKWVNAFDDDTILALRLHPFVSKQYDDKDLDRFGGKVVNLSGYDDINTLLAVSDILITDYSSIIFEYIVFDRPLIFYAYDLASFSDDGRGFYEDYESYVPGKVVYDTDEVIDAVRACANDTEGTKREEFMRHAYRYTDGQSTQRLLNILFGGTDETAR